MEEFRIKVKKGALKVWVSRIQVKAHRAIHNSQKKSAPI